MGKPKITISQRIEAYKYYYPYMENKNLIVLIKTLFAERRIIGQRWHRKKSLNTSEMIFLSHLEGTQYPELAKYFKCSLRRVTSSINEVRSTLINDILKDVEKGYLIYYPPNKKSKKKMLSKAISGWQDHLKAEFGIEAKIKIEPSKSDLLRDWRKHYEEVMNTPI
jgi:hypothetical protein